MIIKVIIAFIYGAIFGSFLNMLSYRLANDISLIKPNRSFCPKCKTKLKFYDNIPIISYLVLKGKCRHCKEPIPIRYLLIELFLAIISSILIIRFDFIHYLINFLFIFLIFCCTITDIEKRIVPYQITMTFPIIFFILSYFHLTYSKSIYDSIISSLIFISILYLINEYGYLFLKRDSIGDGDLKFFYLVGSFFGLKLTSLIFFLSFMIGSIYALILTYINREREIAFIPPIFMSCIISLFFGQKIINWYLSFLS